jgi:ABC-type uncharacterized transport system auxiliary subunit
MKTFLPLLALLSGCALMTTRHPAKIRYFTPEAVSVPATHEPLPTDVELRLARVDAASYIQDRIAFRDATSEVSYYGNLRWAEPPEAYLRRAMARALFQQRGVQEIVSGAGPALEIDLDAFEELTAPRHAARVVVTWRLRDGRTVVRQKTITVEHPIASHELDRVLNADAVADAIAAAMGDVVDGIVVDVLAELGRERGDAIAGESLSARAP